MRVRKQGGKNSPSQENGRYKHLEAGKGTERRSRIRRSERDEKAGETGGGQILQSLIK